MNDLMVWQAPDGTEWLYSPEFDVWNGWQPGEDGLWELTPAEFAAAYPEHGDPNP